MTVEPNITYLRSDALQPAASSSTVQGYTPAQIVHAYGFDQISFDNGAVKGNGAGETIAIVDAYNDPNIAADLSVFDQQFGLSAPASLKVVDETGGSSLPSTNPGWAGEISLDVEWAHAMAPKANILLVEASSASTTDLLDAVDYARKAAGVSVVSMSWGGSEFVDYSGGEMASQLTLDKTFTTPSGHTGVTFIASAGDSGFQDGVQWPSSSPNVISVGGTTLETDSSGNYQSEGPWRGFQEGTSGGFSQYETEPAYQDGAQQSGARSTPDVGYNANPDTGFAIYDSISYQGYVGWQEVGGTSAGAPQWAALVAIANQGRAISGKATLSGTEALTDLYSVYSAPGTSGYSTYTSYFNDIGSDGYGYSTGLGSPKAAQIVALLETSGSSSSTTGTTTTTTTTTTPSPVSVSLESTTATSVLSGSAETVRVKLTNINSTAFSGPVTVSLYASLDGTLSSNDTTLLIETLPKLKLRAFGSTVITLKFKYPAGITTGSYYIVASAQATDTGDAPALVVSPARVAVTQKTADLATAFASASPFVVKPGHKETATITVTNDGNTTATGTLGVSLYESADGSLDIADRLLAAITGRKVHIRAGGSVTLRIHFLAPTDLAAGTYSLIASTTSKTNAADDNAGNDIAVVATA